MSLFDELKRRNVFRVATAYLVVGWLLTEVLTTVLETLGTPGWAPRLVVLIFAFGFIPTVVLSWVFELTPEGLKRDHEIDRNAAEQRRYGNKLDYVTVGGVIVLVLFLAFFSATHGPDEQTVAAPPVSSASVAVLPFVNLSNDEDNEYFSDGLTETLLHMLAQVPDLKVAARTSSFAFKNQNKPIGEIASALGVAHVLEGSVQRSGDRVRVTAQLIRADDGFHVWSEVYDRTLDDIFGIQDEIAEKVGGSLSASLLGTAPANMVAGLSTSDADAYDIYLQALNERATYSYGGLQAAEDLLKGALAIDPDFVEAKAELASNYLAQVETGLMTEDEALPAVQALAEQVLESQPDNVRARAIRVYAEARFAAKIGDLLSNEEAARELAQLVDEDPADFEVRVLYVRMLGEKDQGKAVEVLQAALENDPLNPRILYELGGAYQMVEDLEAAGAALRRSLELEPAQPNAYVHLGTIGLRMGDGVEFIRQFLNAIEVDPKDHELPGMIAAVLYELGMVEEADDFRNRVMAIAPTSEVAYQLNLLRAISNHDKEAAVAAARRAIEDDVPDRRNAWGGAVEYLLRLGANSGTVDEEIAYLESRAPGILDFEAESVPIRYRRAQLSAFDAWYSILPQEEIERRLRLAMGIAESLGMDTDSPDVRMAVAALQRRTEDAVAIALDNIFLEPVTENLGWRRVFSQAQYAAFVEDPRVQAAFHRWEEQEADLRNDIRAYLGDLQAST